MTFPFKELPDGSGTWLRPVVPIVVEGLTVPQWSLVDSGSARNRFGGWIADACGLDLAHADTETISLAGITTTARTVPVRLQLGDVSWEAPVSFCHPWPLGFNVLGLEGFFRWFVVTVRAADGTLDCEPETS